MRLPDVVLVHSMGKVGSYSIYQALLKALSREVCDGRTRILHTHQLNPRTLAGFKQGATGEAGHAAHAQEFLAMDGVEDVRVVTPVREPLARNVSAFFENLGSHGFDGDAAQAPTEALIQTFLNRYKHRIPDTWFDTQVREVFGIDVFAQRLDFSSGGHLIRGQSASMLLLRMEDSDAHKKEAIRQFVGVASFDLPKLNVGSEKAYGDAYHRFVSQFRPEAEFVDNLYASKFARHFYSAEEIQTFRERWMA